MARLACHTAEQTRLCERGYPYMTILVDGHKDDKKPLVAAEKAFKEYYGAYHVRWPRLVAHAFVRGGGSTEPVGPDEAKKLLAATLASKNGLGFYGTFYWIFALEAIAGTDLVLDGVVTGLESLPKARWATRDTNSGERDTNPSLLAYATGLLLLRASDAQRAKSTARLEDVYNAAVRAKVEPGEHTVRGGLDLALHGTDGAKRALANSHWQYWYYYLMVDDPAVHLERLKNNSKSDWVPEARILWLAGEELLPIYTSKKALRQGKRLPHILADFGMFANDAVLSLMIDMVGVKGAGDAPRDYFHANATYVRPKLEKLAKGSSATAVKAKVALGLLG